MYNALCQNKYKRGCPSNGQPLFFCNINPDYHKHKSISKKYYKEKAKKL